MGFVSDVFDTIAGGLFGTERKPPQPNFSNLTSPKPNFNHKPLPLPDFSKNLAKMPEFREPELENIEAPSPSDIDDVLDYIAGVKAVTVTDSSGKKVQEIKRLPRTPEEEQFFRSVPNLLNTTTENLNRLKEYDHTLLIPYMPLINSFANVNQQRLDDISQIAGLENFKQNVQNFRTMQNTLIDEEFKNLNRSLDEDLAHRGLSNSTYAAEAKAALGKQQALARQEGDIRASTYGENLADQRFARNRNIFDVNEQGRQGVLNQAQLDFELQQQQLQNLNAQRQTAIENNANILGIGMGIRNQDLGIAAGSQASNLQAQNYLNRLKANQLNNENQLGLYGARLGGEDRRLQNYQAGLGGELNAYDRLLATQKTNTDADFGNYDLQLKAHQADVGAQFGQYDRQLDAFKAQGPSNRDKFMNLVGGIAGHAIGGPAGGAMMGGLGGGGGFGGGFMGGLSGRSFGGLGNAIGGFVSKPFNNFGNFAVY